MFSFLSTLKIVVFRYILFFYLDYDLRTSQTSTIILHFVLDYLVYLFGTLRFSDHLLSV